MKERGGVLAWLECSRLGRLSYLRRIGLNGLGLLMKRREREGRSRWAGAGDESNGSHLMYLRKYFLSSFKVHDLGRAEPRSSGPRA